MVRSALNILVLTGGPDREREVSLSSAVIVCKALGESGHRVVMRDVLGGDATVLDGEFDVVFPVLHGPFGEGGPLQIMLEKRGVVFVGSGSEAAAIAIDKVASKRVAVSGGIRTPRFEVLGIDDELTIGLPVVLKPIAEGSSFGVEICHTMADVDGVRAGLHEAYGELLAEKYVDGRELTVSIIDGEVLPIIEIVPATPFYSYEAKYDRDDTRYLFDIDLPEEVVRRMRADAPAVHELVGCRHLSRVDFIVDCDNQAWFIEINTIPGFTSHSLVPMAAARAGMDLVALYDRLVRLAVSEVSRNVTVVVEPNAVKRVGM